MATFDQFAYVCQSIEILVAAIVSILSKKSLSIQESLIFTGQKVQKHKNFPFFTVLMRKLGFFYKYKPSVGQC